MEGRGRNQAAKVGLEGTAGQTPDGLGSREQPARLQAVKGSRQEPAKMGVGETSLAPIARVQETSHLTQHGGRGSR